MKKPNTSPKSRFRRFLKTATLAVASLLFTIVIIELFIYHVLDRKPMGYKPERFFQFSALTGYFHKPGAEGYWYRFLSGRKYGVKINSYGFSDSERELEKKRPRIALIGDSVTEFWEIEEPYRGHYVLEKRLGGEYEVLNLGVRGYGTDQTYILFKYIGVHFTPDIVVYVFCINDIADNANTESKPYFVIDPQDPEKIVLRGFPVRYAGPKRKTGFLYNSSFIYRHLQELRNTLKIGTRMRRRAGSPNPEPNFELRPYKKDYNTEDARRLRITTAIISRLDSYLAQRGMRLLVVESPFKSVIDTSNRREIVGTYGDIFDFEKVSTVLDSYCRDNGIPFLSLPELIKTQNLTVSDLMNKEDFLHFNARGAEFFAQAVAAKLESLGWVEERD